MFRQMVLKRNCVVVVFLIDHFAIPSQDLKIKWYIVELKVLSYYIGRLYFFKTDLSFARRAVTGASGWTLNDHIYII